MEIRPTYPIFLEDVTVNRHIFFLGHNSISAWEICPVSQPVFFGKYHLQAWYISIICDISAFYFGTDFPFNIGLYDNFFHYFWVTMQLVMDILLNLFT